MQLVIAEKPSVARDIARVLGVRGRGRGYLEGGDTVVTWCVGHLVELHEPAHYDPKWRPWRLDRLPMVPEQFELRVRQGASDQWRVVKRLLTDDRFDEVINACDAGREGELIFRYVYDLAGCSLPIKRLWLASMTDAAIRRAFGALRSGAELEPLADAARCRSEADWLVGLNATRAMTCLARKAGGDDLLSVGRVQTPTLAMIVARDREIEQFEPTTFWRVRAQFAVERDDDEPASWQGTWFREDSDDSDDSDDTPVERIYDLEVAEALAAAAEGREGTVVSSGRKKTRDKPPLLYDLTALQRRANQRYGFSADRTLSLAQDLYEKHKLLTYPRTDSRHLTPDEVPQLADIVESLGRVPVYEPFADAILASPIEPGKRVVDASEVGDHHAIIPTGRAPTRQGLSADEKRVFDLVARRLLAALSEDALFEKTRLVVAVDPGDAEVPDDVEAPLRFRAKGKVCVRQGWRAVDPPKRKRENLLPQVAQGAVAQVAGTSVDESQTRPPRAYNDASLLKAMETAGRDLDDAALKRAMKGAGLGTPATRAAILKTLLSRGYVRRDKRKLHATDRGRMLIDAVPVDELKSAELTGRWESRLSEMAEGDEQRARFMADVVENVRGVVQAIAAAEPPVDVVATDKKSLGECPACGKPVFERRKVWSCASGRGCPFVVFKTMSKRTISTRMVTTLLAEGRTPPVKGFKSKKGKAFRAGLVVRDDGSVGFWFPNDRGGSGSGRRSSGGAGRDAEGQSPSTPVGMSCPKCGQGQLIRGRTAWGCNRWRDGCRYTVPFVIDGRSLTPAEAVEHVQQG